MNIGRKIFNFTIYQVQNIPCCYITFPFEPEIYCTVLWIGIIPEENQFTRRFLSQALENQLLLTGCIRNIPNTEFLLQIVEPQPTSKQASSRSRSRSHRCSPCCSRRRPCCRCRCRRRGGGRGGADRKGSG